MTSGVGRVARGPPAAARWRSDEGAGPSTAAPARATVTGAHLVGSVNLPTAEEVLGTVAERLGEHITHIPDGEVGERYYWLQFQTRRFDRTPGLVRLGDTPILIRGEFDQRPFALDGSVAAEDLRFPDLGYADAAIESFATFARLQEAGTIPAGTRFQVSLPTPAAVVGVFFAPQDRAAIEPVYTAALFAELDRIAAAIPHGSLAIQWDTAVEFAWLEQAVLGGFVLAPWWDDVLDGRADAPRARPRRRCPRTCRRVPPLLRRRRGGALRAAEGRGRAGPGGRAGCSSARRGRSPRSTSPCRSSATTPPTSHRCGRRGAGGDRPVPGARAPRGRRRGRARAHRRGLDRGAPVRRRHRVRLRAGTGGAHRCRCSTCTGGSSRPPAADLYGTWITCRGGPEARGRAGVRSRDAVGPLGGVRG